MTRHSRLDLSSSEGSDWSSSDDDDDEELAPLPAQRSTGLGVWILLLLGVCAVVGTALLVVFLQRKDGAGTGAATQEAAAATNPVVESINSPDKYDSPPIIDQGDGEGQDDLTTTPARIRRSTSTSSSKSKPTGSSSPSNSSSSSGTSNLPPLVGSQLLVDFSTFTSGDTPSFLTSHSLQISTDPIGSTPISHTFLASNVDIVDGAWRLKVTGQSGNGDIKSASSYSSHTTPKVSETLSSPACK